MTISIIYHTRFGNNAEVAQSLSDTLESAGHGVSIHPITEARPSEIPASDLYIVGGPTQIGTIPLKLDRFLKRLKIPKGSRYAVYSTHAEANSAAPGKISAIMEAHGAQAAAGPLLLSVKGLKGPLEEEWELKVGRWSEDLK